MILKKTKNKIDLLSNTPKHQLFLKLGHSQAPLSKKGSGNNINKRLL